MVWTRVAIWYGDGRCLSVPIEDWATLPGENVQVVRVCSGRRAYVLHGYDYYALWTEVDDLVLVQAGPKAEYGYSQRIRLRGSGNDECTDFNWDDLPVSERDFILSRSKNGKWSDEATYVAIQNRAFGPCGCG